MRGRRKLGSAYELLSGSRKQRVRVGFGCVLKGKASLILPALPCSGAAGAELPGEAD